MTDEQRTLLRTKCKELINDDSPLVRRTFANQLEALIDVIEKDNVVTDFIPIFHELADDDQVRIYLTFLFHAFNIVLLLLLL